MDENASELTKSVPYCQNTRKMLNYTPQGVTDIFRPNKKLFIRSNGEKNRETFHFENFQPPIFPYFWRKSLTPKNITEIENGWKRLGAHKKCSILPEYPKDA